MIEMPHQSGIRFGMAWFYLSITDLEVQLSKKRVSCFFKVCYDR